MTDREFMMNEVIEIERDIEEAKKKGFLTGGLEKMKAEYLEKLGDFDREEAERIYHENEIATANYCCEMWV